MDSIQATRERLPIFKAKCEIIEAVRQNKTSIFVGETGCGKTTQIPQYLLEAGFAKHKCIAVTQVGKLQLIIYARILKGGGQDYDKLKNLFKMKKREL
ncbi:UNVERIFIED_CONTAM: pre-mRNA-splicing factor ATP-dependent RNA helicase DEAH9 [Trichonephila clavipes]